MIGGIAFEDGCSSRRREQEAKERRRENAEQIALIVKSGMTRNWQRVSVWPGLALVPASVRLYTTPTLHEDTEISWPGPYEVHDLAAQRPFMISRCLALNKSAVDPPADLVGSEVMGVWLPETEDIVFFDRAANYTRILLPTNSGADIYDSNFEDIKGEDVILEKPLENRGLTWRYLEINRPPPYEGNRVVKVCGRSAWLDLGQQAEVIKAYETGWGDDPVQLPGLITS